MRCVVAGAAGFIGSHLAERLCAQGHEVLGVDSFVTGQRANQAYLSRYPNYSMLEQDIVHPLAISAPVDVVYNFACPASPVDFGPLGILILRTCSEGTLNLLEVARRHGAVFVHASTSECYGDPLEHPQSESYWGNVNPVGLRSVYDEGKRYAEALVMAHHREHGMCTALGRIFNTYGPRMRQGDGRVLPNFIEQALRGEPLTVYGAGSQTRSFCYVSDLVEAFLQLSRCTDPQPVNIGNPAEITIIELAREIIELTASSSSIEFRALPEDDPKVRRPDIRRAEAVLGWTPRTPRAEGLKRTVAHFRTILSQARPA